VLLLFWVFSLSGRDWGAVGCSQRTMMMGLGEQRRRRGGRRRGRERERRRGGVWEWVLVWEGWFGKRDPVRKKMSRRRRMREESQERRGGGRAGREGRRGVTGAHTPASLSRARCSVGARALQRMRGPQRGRLGQGRATEGGRVRTGNAGARREREGRVQVRSAAALFVSRARARCFQVVGVAGGARTCE